VQRLSVHCRCSCLRLGFAAEDADDTLQKLALPLRDLDGAHSKLLGQLGKYLFALDGVHGNLRLERRGEVPTRSTARLLSSSLPFWAANRFVKRGEKGILILAPMVGNRRKKDDTDRNQTQDASTKPTPVLIGSRAVCVFDMAQTGRKAEICEDNTDGERAPYGVTLNVTFQSLILTRLLGAGSGWHARKQ
jgi:hypothetical protein